MNIYLVSLTLKKGKIEMTADNYFYGTSRDDVEARAKKYYTDSGYAYQRTNYISLIPVIEVSL